jgi:predicted Co/Zn/Cd cation transporter (cation efflux family)
MPIREQIDLERGANRISITGRILIIAFEIVIIFVTSSQAILIDAAFDVAELITVVLSYIFIPKWFSPPSERRPYGLAQGEAWLVLIKTLLANTMGVILILINIVIIARGGNEVELDEAALLELISAALAIAVVTVLKRRNRTLKSPSLEADIESWNTDVFASVTVGAAFLLAVFVENGVSSWIIPHIDPIIAIVFAVVMMRGPVRTLLFELKNLTLIEACPETTAKVHAAANPIIAARQIGEPIYYILETGRKTWVSVYIASDANTIPKSEYLETHREIRAALLQDFPNLFIEVLPDIQE